MNIAAKSDESPGFRFPAPCSGVPKNGPRPVVEPVFLPYFGCPFRCIYCSQNAQTGVSDISLDRAYEELKSRLEQKRREKSPPFEVAFYGGTFTMLPGDRAETFVSLAGEYAKQGVVTGIRCSTRPDSVHGDILPRLKGLGLTMVELGVQSFDDQALAATERGYSREQALAGCRAVTDAGLELGVQLMPGLPGDRPGVFAEDVRTTLETGASVVRLYPCLVLEGTELAKSWRAGKYLPWTLEHAAAELGTAVLEFWKAGVKVIRIGLAPQEGLTILAGPAHPALGQSVQARAVFEWTAEHVQKSGVQSPRKLLVPRSHQGMFWGHKGELKPAYARLGITPGMVEFHDREDFALH